jgi:hypothetical protein
MVASNDPVNSFIEKMDSRLKTKNQVIRVPDNINNLRMIEKVVQDGDDRLQTESLPAFEELSHCSIDQISQSEQAIENMSVNSEIEMSKDDSVQPFTSQEHKPMPSKPSKVLKATGVKVIDKSAMSRSEKKEQERLENKAKRGLVDFCESLSEIKELKLYRERADGTKRTWEQYCLEVFGQTKQNIAKDIRANATFHKIQNMGTFISPHDLNRSVLLCAASIPEEHLEQSLIHAKEIAGNNKIELSDFKTAYNSISPPSPQLDTLSDSVTHDPIVAFIDEITEITKRVRKIKPINIQECALKENHYKQIVNCIFLIQDFLSPIKKDFDFAWDKIMDSHLINHVNERLSNKTVVNDTPERTNDQQ